MAQAVLGPPKQFGALGDGSGSAGLDEEADPLIVQVLDAGNNPIQDVEVRWSLQSGGGALADSLTTTDSLGVTSNLLTVGSSLGENEVTATVVDLDPVVFRVTSLPVSADPPFDHSGAFAPDIVAYGAVIFNDSLLVHVRVRDTPFPPSAVTGFVEIDADQDSTTGIVVGFIEAQRPDTGTHGLGVDYAIPFRVGSAGTGVWVFSEPNMQQIGTFTPSFTGTVVTLRVPMSLLADDGNMDLVIMAGPPRSGLGILDTIGGSDVAPSNGNFPVVP